MRRPHAPSPAPRPPSSSAAPSPVSDGAPPGTDAAGAAALTDRDGRYRSLIDRVGLGTWRASEDGKILDANPTLTAMLGYDHPDELRGCDLATDVYVEASEHDRLIEHAGRGEFGEWMETRWRRRDGTPLTVRIALLADGDQRARGYEGIAEDVTERVRRDELLRRSERMASLGTTLAGVAHELNNPLAAILGFAQLLLRKAWPEEERGALETISHEAERSAKIVHDLLALARKREGDRQTPLALNDVVGYIVRTRRYALDASGVACEMQLDPGLPLVRGDRAQLEQVVLNLITNAEQALRPSADAASAERPSHTPRVGVRTWRQGGQVILEVRDNGPGIADGAETRIWDPFYTTHETGDGTGLGLTVVNSIVTEHGGTIEVENDPDGGARFVVRLPALAARVSEPAPSSGATATRALDVLVIDTEAVDLSFVRRFLTSRGHAVLASNEISRAYSLAQRLAFDVVICEAGVASEHPQLVERAGANGRRIIVAGEPADASRFPADVVTIQKPFDVEVLRRAVEGA